MVIHKIHAKSGGTKLSDCKVEVKNFQKKTLYITTLRNKLLCQLFRALRLRWISVKKKVWRKNQNPDGHFGATSAAQ